MYSSLHLPFAYSLLGLHLSDSVTRSLLSALDLSVTVSNSWAPHVQGLTSKLLCSQWSSGSLRPHYMAALLLPVD